MQSAITSGLLWLMAATLVAGAVGAVIGTAPRRSGSRAPRACPCTRGDCSSCPARWSL